MISSSENGTEYFFQVVKDKNKTTIPESKRKLTKANAILGSLAGNFPDYTFGTIQCKSPSYWGKIFGNIALI